MLLSDILWVVLLGLVVLAGILWLGQSIFADSQTDSVFVGALTAVIIAQILWMVAFQILADYYLDIWIITNQRSIRIELQGFFSRKVTSVNHDRIQDISVTVYGLIPTLLNYGNLHIQTAGAIPNFVFNSIPEPYKTKDIIYKAAKEYGKKEHPPDG